MPAKLDRCVSSLLTKWEKDPDEAPARYKSGDKWIAVKGPKDLESAAFAICRASTGLCEQFDSAIAAHEAMADALLDDDPGQGPVLRGVAFVNRPYIKNMNPLEIVWRNGKQMIKAQIVKFGTYLHPNGPNGLLPFTPKFWQRVRKNFESGVYGQKVFGDKAHAPNAGSMGELEFLEPGDGGMNAYFDPTPTGLEVVRNKDVNYASIDLEWNYHDKLIAVSASDQLEDVGQEQVFNALAAEQVLLFTEEERPMPKDKSLAANPPVDEQDASVDVAAVGDELRALQVKLDEQQKQLERQQSMLEQQQSIFAQEQERFQAERDKELERIRRRQVAVFLQDLGQPRDGRALDKPVLDLIGTILLGDAVESEGEATIQLDDSSSNANIHAYYRQAVERLAEIIPRTVPVGVQLESMDKRPKDGSNGARLAARDKAKAEMLLAKQAEGVEVTEEIMAQIEARLDRAFGGGE